MDIINVQVFLDDLRLKNGFSEWFPGIYFSNIPFNTIALRPGKCYNRAK